MLALGALGVVYGDIGTSPLYSMRECFVGAGALPITDANVLGILSLIFWSRTMVVSIKYLTFVMRADNEGEGGILALLALVSPRGNGGAHGAQVWCSSGCSERRSSTAMASLRLSSRCCRR